MEKSLMFSEVRSCAKLCVKFHFVAVEDTSRTIRLVSVAICGSK